MTNTNYRPLRFLGLTSATVLFLCAQNATAQATRTWVSGVGDDVNPCSRTAPCKTFAGAISKTATAGEINIIDPGGYGGVTITKSITINGDGSYGSILVSSGANGIIVNLPSANDSVIIRNVSINGIGTGLNGIRMISGGSLFVENVQIQQFADKGISFEPNGAAKLFVTNTEIRNTGGGVFVKPVGVSTLAHLDGVILEKNTFGVRAEAGAVVTAQNTTAAGNLNSGYFAYSVGLPAQISLENSSAVGQRNPGSNSSGIRSEGAQATVRISNVVVTNNDIGLNAIGGSIASWSNNKVAGNSVNGSPNSTIIPQ